VEAYILMYYISISYYNIGCIYESNGDFDKALEYDFKSLEIYKAAYLANHPSIAISYNNIG